jgi:hypothetical protein
MIQKDDFGIEKILGLECGRQSGLQLLDEALLAQDLGIDASPLLE